MWVHNAKSVTPSVVYSVIQQVKQDMVRRDVIGERLDAHIAMLLDTHAAAEGVCKRLLASRSFMAPIATFHESKMDSDMDDKK